MSGPGFALFLDDRGPPPTPFLRVGPDPEADIVPDGTGMLPIEDGAADTIVATGWLQGLSLGARLGLLIDCRRVLRPGGLLTVPAALRDEAALLGLETVPENGVEIPPGTGDDTIRLTKRDRRLHHDPLVTVAIPAYGPRYFAAALDSALAQTYEPLEIVVSDDGEGGEIEALVAARQRRRPIRYERNPVRRGPRGNFLRTFARAEGEFIKFLCDDDLLAPTCVADLLDAFRHAPDVTLATSRRRRIGTAGERLPDLPATTPIVADDALVAGHSLANAMLMAGLNTLGEPSSGLFRKLEFPTAATDGFRFGTEHGHGIIDMILWTSLLMKGNGVYRRAPLSSFRTHPQQRQNDPAKRARNIQSIRSLQAAWLALGLAGSLPPDQVLAKPFPPQGTDWRWQPLRGFVARPVERPHGP